jgi:hypothetical protein
MSTTTKGPGEALEPPANPTSAEADDGSEDAYLRRLTKADWQKIFDDLRAHARKHHVPKGKAEEVIQTVCGEEIDPAERKWKRAKRPDFVVHLRARFNTVAWNDRVLMDNNLAQMPEEADAPAIHASRDPVSASPERLLGSAELWKRAAPRLRELAADQPILLAILEQRLEGVATAGAQAENIGHSPEEIRNATKRLDRLAEQVARELGFASRRAMLAAGVKERPAGEAKARPVPSRTAAVWTWLFAAGYAGGVAAFAVLIRRGSALAAVGALVGFALALALVWGAWFHASWLRIPPQFRYATPENRLLVTPWEMLRPLLVARGNVAALFRVTAGLCHAVDFASDAARAPSRLVRVACRLTASPAIVVAPVVWVVAMHRVDRATAPILARWRKWTARDAARFGAGAPG